MSLTVVQDFQKHETQPSFLQGGQLHPYQLEGVNWLRHSWQGETNVILADEMGLGKTIQTIAFLACLHDEWTVGPFLLVVPLSTLRNWHREFQFWAPHMNVVVYTGSQESRAMIRKYEFYEEITAAQRAEQPKKKKNEPITPKFHALMTSYELVLQDNATLQKFAWKTLVVDEAHRLKNNNSRLFQVLKEYDTYHKLLLTGTPLQNNLQELFHLLNFLQPDRFASLEDFEREFSHIDKEEQIARLHKMLAPHLLRRLKEDVMKGLPPKSEFIVRVDFTKLQQQYYMAILTKNKKVLHHNVKGSAQVSLLNIIAELQKCANHPYLFAGAEPTTSTPQEALQALIEASGKLQLVDKMLTHLKGSGHRVLIFSQMTRMLDILEDYMNYRHYDYERIDGQVTGHLRQERIDRFNSRSSTSFCFLLSTKAGGLGINLATADTVLIYDSDWNPHNDIQALSRAHRIGQANKVLIYRLVTRYSIEERIIQRSKEKLMLDHLVVRKMGAKGETLLREGELDDILRFGAAKLFGDENNRDHIRYDDSAVAKLLDRSATGIEEKAAAQNDYLNSFKVANIETVGEKDKGAPGDAGGKDGEKTTGGTGAGDGFWEQLLGAQTEAEKGIIAHSEKRSTRKGIRYIEADARTDESDDEWETAPGNDGGSDEDSKPTASKRGKTKAGDSSLLLDGEGKAVRVMGLSSYQRATFLKLLMLHGYGDGTWAHFLGRPLGNLRAKPLELLARYGDLVMQHLLEPVTDTPTFADGVPRDGIRPKFVLQRLVILQLIHAKVKQTPNVEAFDIVDGGWTELARTWKDHTSLWTKAHDFAYLLGTFKHGYGKWAEIVFDVELSLVGPLQASVRIAEAARRKDKPAIAVTVPPSGTLAPYGTAYGGAPLLGGGPPTISHTPVPAAAAAAAAVQHPPPRDTDDVGGVEKEEVKEEEEEANKDDEDNDKNNSVDQATIKFMRNRLALLEKALFVEAQLKSVSARYAPPAQPTLITAEIHLPTPLYPRALLNPAVVANTPAQLTVLPPQPTAAATARLAFLLAWRELYDFVKHMSATSARSEFQADAGQRYRRDLKTLDTFINNARDRLRECLKDG